MAWIRVNSMKNPISSEHTKRLDVEVAFRGLARSRSSAVDLIRREKISVNKIIVSKPNTLVSPHDIIEIVDAEKFVSRAGEKLEHALKTFNISPAQLIALDIGSSTGGFTDCLLQHGATKVIAVDVGTNQLVSGLKNDPRVELHESTNIKSFILSSLVDLVTIDVSFISLVHVLPKAFSSLKKSGDCIALIKPQFEVGMEIAKKFRGVITDESLQKEVLTKMKLEAQNIGFTVIGETPSPIVGEKGNREFLIHLKK